MPFDVTRAAAHVRRVVLEFNSERLKVHYNAGEKFRDYQTRTEKLEREFADLQRKLQASEATDSDEAYRALMARMETTRRALADNICTVIESWDLEGDRDAIRGLMSKEDQKRHKNEDGHGPIPVDGAWLDALPLPDEFILRIINKINEDFAQGGAAGKGR